MYVLLWLESCFCLNLDCSVEKNHIKNKVMLDTVKNNSSLRIFITNKQANRYCDKTSYKTN